MSGLAVPYWHVDAFASSAFGGNQAAVMLFESFPGEAVMQAIAAENMFAETAFLVAAPLGQADYELRWFTPECEVAMCGHATLAAGHVILTQEPERQSVTFATRKAGILSVARAGRAYELALPVITLDDNPPSGIALGLGGEPEGIRWNKAGHCLARYSNEAAIRSLLPDMETLASHGDTMFIATARGDRADIVSRVFVPGAGIPEDSVTGSAHAALTPYWADILGVEAFTAHQASRRGGDITCRLEGDRAILGGNCVTIVAGSFYLTG